MAAELPLLEREAALCTLRAALLASRAGQGRCVCLVGEAGIGKTRLLDAFQTEIANGLRWLRAGCDPLSTPRPLGPLVDLVPLLPPALGQAVHAARTHNGLFPALLQWLAQPSPPAVLVLEDLHWADEATLDALRYLGRRLAGVPLLLLLSWRDEGAGPPPGLRHALAQIDPACTTELRLPPLSAAAVKTLADAAGRDAAAMLALTAGNPLFVQQLLACAPGAVPGGVREAVLGRLDACDPEARAVAQVLSISPGGLEWALLVALQTPVLTAPQIASGCDPGVSPATLAVAVAVTAHLPAHLPANLPAALDRLVAAGLVRVQPPLVAFRHELARLAVHDALPPAGRVQLHAGLAALLASLPARPGLLARRVHHAAEGARPDEVCALAGAAADEALRVGAHAAAAALLQRALAQADAAGADDATRAGWCAALGRQLSRRGDLPGALDAWRQALTLQERRGDRPGQANALANLALLTSPRPESVDMARQAHAWLANTPPSAVRAVTAYTLALSLVNRGEAAAALAPAAEAVQLAEAAGDVSALSQALSVSGAARLSVRDDEAGFAQIERGIALADAQHLVDHAASGWVNLASLCLTHARYPRLFAACALAVPWCQARDQDWALALLQLCRAVGLTDTGRWDEARQTLDLNLDAPQASERSRASAAVLRQRLRALCGEADEQARWQQLVQQVEQGHTDFQPADGMVWAAEAAWLRGDAAASAAWARRALAQAAAPWLLGRVRRWLRLAGAALPPAPADLPAPFVHEEAGRWQAAQQAWHAAGSPYEAALVGLEGDVPALQLSLQQLTALGAAAAAVARRRLHQQGERRGTRGPYRAAAQHPLGFTAREQQVALWLAQGLGNADIAARLHRSERTVEHHVSAVMAKLGVATRALAVARLGRPPA